MSHSRSLNFANQDLRHRSFRNQPLQGADFSGANIRGCDFSGAELTGANFEQTKAGQTQRQRWIWTGIAIATFVGMGYAVSRLVSSSLGQTPADRAWNYVMALVFSLGLTGVASGLRPFLKPLPKQISKAVAGVMSGAIAGFFYVGSATANNPGWAVAGAVLGAVLVGVLMWRFNASSGAIAISVASAISSYGFTLLIGATAISFLSIHYFLSGFLLSGVCLVFLWLTVHSSAIAIHDIHHAPGTLFRFATLTGAQFTGAQLLHTDFFQAVGVDREKPGSCLD